MVLYLPTVEKRFELVCRNQLRISKVHARSLFYERMVSGLKKARLILVLSPCRQIDDQHILGVDARFRENNPQMRVEVGPRLRDQERLPSLQLDRPEKKRSKAAASLAS